MRKLVFAIIFVFIFICLVSCHIRDNDVFVSVESGQNDTSTNPKTTNTSIPTSTSNENINTTQNASGTIPEVEMTVTDVGISEAIADSQAEPYLAALAYLEEGNIQEAYDLLLTIKDYRDVNDYLMRFSFRYEKVVCSSPQSKNTVYYEYDEYGKTLLELHFSSHDQSVYFSTYEYDENANLIKHVYQTESLRLVTLYEYDDNNIPYRKSDSFGFVTGLEYDLNGNIVKITHQDGQTVEYTYDASGNVLTTVSKTDSIVDLIRTYEYDTFGNCIKAKTEYGLDEENSGYIITTNQYDAKGNLVKQEVEQSNGISYFSEYEYDEMGNKIKYASYHPQEGSFAIFAWKYDEKGNITESHREDENGRDYSYLYQYDFIGNCIQTTYILHESESVCVTTYEYDDYGNLLKKIVSGETDSPDDDSITTYMGYKLYYNPYEVRELPSEFVGNG